MKLEVFQIKKILLLVFLFRFRHHSCCYFFEDKNIIFLFSNLKFHNESNTTGSIVIQLLILHECSDYKTQKKTSLLSNLELKHFKKMQVLLKL